MTYYLAQERWAVGLIYGPKKWRYKESKEKPSPRTDVILFGQDGNTNWIKSYEVKVRATKYEENVVEKVYDKLYPVTIFIT